MRTSEKFGHHNHQVSKRRNEQEKTKHVNVEFVEAINCIRSRSKTLVERVIH